MDWRKKLYHQETPPPESVWEALSVELRDDPAFLRLMLRNQEVEAPPMAWEKIRAELGEPSPAVVPMNEPALRKPFWHYVAAAAVIGITVAGILFLSPDGRSPVPATDMATSLSSADSPPRLNGSATSPAEQEPASTSEKPQPGDLAIANAKSPGTRPKDILPATSDAEVPAAMPRRAGAEKPKLIYTDGNYIQVASEDGQYRRVSYKCENMLPCLVKGKRKAEPKPCDENLEKWKMQLGLAGFVPAGDNFFDIAGMAQMLEASK
jgi:hypothetical protein